MGMKSSALLYTAARSQTCDAAQAWIEASTKGAVLLFTASEIETASVSMGVSPAVAGLLGGMGGGIAQAYATMGEFGEDGCPSSELSLTRLRQVFARA